MSDDRWARAAEALASDPFTVEQLLVRHTPDADGKCRACTTGGVGARATPWPCGPHAMASAARRVQDEQRSGEQPPDTRTR